MLCHVVLGFLRDGRARHGYELLTDYRARLGDRLNPGSLYRELGRLAAEGSVQTGAKPLGADPRRIPYQITEHGRQRFDRWLASPSSEDGDFPAWLLFIDRIPAKVRGRILDRRQEDLWVRGKMLARTREDALGRQAREVGEYDPLPALLSRRMKLLAAEVEFLAEFKHELDAWAEAQDRAGQEQAESSRRSERRRTKGRAK